MSRDFEHQSHRPDKHDGYSDEKKDGKVVEQTDRDMASEREADVLHVADSYRTRRTNHEQKGENNLNEKHGDLALSHVAVKVPSQKMLESDDSREIRAESVMLTYIWNLKVRLSRRSIGDHVTADNKYSPRLVDRMQ